MIAPITVYVTLRKVCASAYPHLQGKTVLWLFVRMAAQAMDDVIPGLDSVSVEVIMKVSVARRRCALFIALVMVNVMIRRGLVSAIKSTLVKAARSERAPTAAVAMVSVRRTGCVLVMKDLKARTVRKSYVQMIVLEMENVILK